MNPLLTSAQPAIIVGVDAHKDTHHAVVITATGSRLGDQEFSATTKGYRRLLEWAERFGCIDKIGMESIGSYSAALTGFLIDAGKEVREVNTPHPHMRARKGKDDVIDAEAAARKVLAGEATAKPKTTTGMVESIRLLSVARDSAVKTRSIALLQLQSILITAPAEIREQITAKTGRAQAARCARFRPDTAHLGDPVHAAKMALRTLAQRICFLDEEVSNLDSQLQQLVSATAPTLVSRLGIGTGHAAQFLVTAGQNIDRINSEAAFARLCGAAPIPVSSGKTHRMRLHRGGDRQANRALHMIAVCRLRYDPRSIEYMQRRIADGLSKKDVLRCLKRFIAREVFNDLKTDIGLT